MGWSYLLKKMKLGVIKCVHSFLEYKTDIVIVYYKKYNI